MIRLLTNFSLTICNKTLSKIIQEKLLNEATLQSIG